MESEDPVRQFEHAHGHLNRLVVGVAELLRKEGASTSESAKKLLAESLRGLRDELLQHFADEEEALFPFVRASVPSKLGVVTRLEAAHDTICGCVVRMVHLAGGEHPASSLLSLHERFEHAYTQHSSDEARLFEELGQMLDGPQRQELAKRLRGL